MPNNKSLEKLEYFYDALADSIFEESDDEIQKDLESSGFDFTAESIRLKKMLSETIISYRKRHLDAARAGYKSQIEQMQKKPYSFPKSAELRRKLFTSILKNPRFEPYLTAQHRNHEALTDNDIITYLEDLVELGILHDIDSDISDDGKE